MFSDSRMIGPLDVIGTGHGRLRSRSDGGLALICPVRCELLSFRGLSVPVSHLGKPAFRIARFHVTAPRFQQASKSMQWEKSAPYTQLGFETWPPILYPALRETPPFSQF